MNELFIGGVLGLSVLGLIVGVGVCIGVFLLLREFACWYSKINKRLEHMEAQTGLLTEHTGLLMQIRDELQRAQYR
jgi:hypothetical protein